MSEKLEGEWFEGNVFKYEFTSNELRDCKKYEEGVKKPTALRTKVIGDKEYSQYYYKPIGVDEFWD